MKTRKFPHARGNRHKQHTGLTLIELVIVLAILVALAGIAVPRLFSTSVVAQENTTRASAVEIRDAMMQFWSDCKYAYPASPIEDQRIQLAHLLQQPSFVPSFDPKVGLGWNGPYLQTDGRNYPLDIASGFTTNYGDTSQASVRDTFSNRDDDADGNKESGSPFVIQEPMLLDLENSGLSYSIGQPREVRIVSAGPDGILEIDERRFASELESSPSLKGDDVYVTLTLR